MYNVLACLIQAFYVISYVLNVQDIVVQGFHHILFFIAFLALSPTLIDYSLQPQVSEVGSWFSGKNKALHMRDT
jgi:hypothetical protein